VDLGWCILYLITNLDLLPGRHGSIFLLTNLDLLSGAGLIAGGGVRF
jgi:hypothetical protein